MPGINNILQGLYWSLAGLIFSAVTYFIAPGGYYVVMSGAIIWGLFKLIAGICVFINYQFSGSDEKNRNKENIAKTIMMQSMIALAIDEEDLTDNHVQVIAGLYRKLSGDSLEKKRIQESFKIIKLTNFDIEKAARESRYLIDHEYKISILKSMYLSSLLNDYLTTEKMKKIIFIGMSLKLPAEEVLASIKSFKAELQNTQQAT